MGFGTGINPDAPQGGGQVPSGGGGAGIIGAILQTGAGLYDSYQNRKTAKENTDKTISAQKAESELAYQRALEMWHIQNGYNSPLAQMERFKSAGLNPHMIYGQGNPGNASAPPAYQPPNIQYKYESGNYGHAIASILPTLLTVGTWMQDMRLKETQIDKYHQDIDASKINVDKVREIIAHMRNMNPKLVERLENELQLFPYQETIQAKAAQEAGLKVDHMVGDLQYKYGEDFATDSGWKVGKHKGVREIQALREAAKLKIDEAKASWTDMNITDPQALIQMVLSGVMGMAGIHMRKGSTPKGKPASSKRDPIRDIKSKPKRELTDPAYQRHRGDFDLPEFGRRMQRGEL